MRNRPSLSTARCQDACQVLWPHVSNPRNWFSIAGSAADLVSALSTWRNARSRKRRVWWLGKIWPGRWSTPEPAIARATSGHCTQSLPSSRLCFSLISSCGLGHLSAVHVGVWGASHWELWPESFLAHLELSRTRQRHLDVWIQYRSRGYWTGRKQRLGRCLSLHPVSAYRSRKVSRIQSFIMVLSRCCRLCSNGFSIADATTG